MLRITTCTNSKATCLIVEGKLAGACVIELEKAWRATATAKLSESLQVDLSGVTFVDSHGKELLACMHEQGIVFVASGLLAKSLVDEIGGTP
jgi:anti-anti-sigma regulatory factor